MDRRDHANEIGHGPHRRLSLRETTRAALHRVRWPSRSRDALHEISPWQCAV